MDKELPEGLTKENLEFAIDFLDNEVKKAMRSQSPIAIHLNKVAIWLESLIEE